MKEKESDFYPEASVPRMAYLLSHGHRAIGCRWYEGKDKKPSLELRFKKTAKLSKDLMDFKGSGENLLLDRYISLLALVSQYRRGIQTLNPIAFSVESVNNFVPHYGKAEND